MLYSNEDLVLGNLINNDDGKRISDDDDDDGGGQRSRNGGPKLRVVVGDLVVSSRRNVYHGRHKKLKKDSGSSHVTSLLMGRSTYNASSSTNTSVNDVNDVNGSLLANDFISNNNDEGDDDAILQDAISGATVLISCLGTRRRTNVWTDFLRVPILRIVRCNNVGQSGQI